MMLLPDYADVLAEVTAAMERKEPQRADRPSKMDEARRAAQETYVRRYLEQLCRSSSVRS